MKTATEIKGKVATIGDRMVTKGIRDLGSPTVMVEELVY